MSNHSENSFTRFLSGKGFYFVLALCLAGAGAAAYLAVETAPGAVTEPCLLYTSAHFSLCTMLEIKVFLLSNRRAGSFHFSGKPRKTRV